MRWTGLALTLPFLLSLASSACRERSPGPDASSGSGQAAAPVTASVLSPVGRAGKVTFDRTCIACHDPRGGPRVGPDVGEAVARRGRDWLARWLADPAGLVATDSVARVLHRAWGGIPMPGGRLAPREIDQVLAYLEEVDRGASVGDPVPRVLVPDTLDPQAYGAAAGLYFDACVGCHGVLREGGPGPDLRPARTRFVGSATLAAALLEGLPGGMPAGEAVVGREGLDGAGHAGALVRFLQMDVPAPPSPGPDQVRGSWEVEAPPGSRPVRPPRGRDVQDYFAVVLGGGGPVAVLDGKSRALVGLVDGGRAVDALRVSASGRYLYAVGRDGRITLVDLWLDPPAAVAAVRGCVRARDAAVSRAEGWADRYLVVGCTWPPGYAVLDGRTLEPLSMVPVDDATTGASGAVAEGGVAALGASRREPLWVMGLETSGEIELVDYARPGFPPVGRIRAERFLGEGGWDPTDRYYVVASGRRDRMVVLDLVERTGIAVLETGLGPHPGRGASWTDPEFGAVGGILHQDEPLLVVYGIDPLGAPEHAWRVVRRVVLESAGGRFLKTRPGSPWVWMDMPGSNDPDAARRVCVYRKATARVERCWDVATHGAVLHFAYDRDGTEVWVSVDDWKGEIVVYDDRTLAEKERITGEWLTWPRGKVNVHEAASAGG